MSNFQAVIFDLDGTLINSVPDIANACNAALAQRNHPLHNYEEYKQLIGKGLRNLCERALPLDKQSEEEIEACHAILLGYQIRILLHVMLHAMAKLFQRRRFVFKADGRVFHVRRVNGQNVGGIFQTRFADDNVRHEQWL